MLHALQLAVLLEQPQVLHCTLVLSTSIAHCASVLCALFSLENAVKALNLKVNSTVRPNSRCACRPDITQGLSAAYIVGVRPVFCFELILVNNHLVLDIWPHTLAQACVSTPAICSYCCTRRCSKIKSAAAYCTHEPRSGGHMAHQQDRRCTMTAFVTSQGEARGLP